MSWKERFSEIGEKAGNNLGRSVSISGNYAIVGENFYSVGPGLTTEGKAYWYERQNDGKWKEVHSVVGEKADSQIGYSVSISGNYAVVGAVSYSVGTASNEGKAYWYERQNDGKWKEVHSVVGEKAGSLFGYSVSISGNYAIVGADNYSIGPGLTTEGKAYWYERQNDGKWKEVHSVIGEQAGSIFGWSVSISGNYAVVGAYLYSVGPGDTNEGKAYWYERQNDGKWKEVHSVVGEKAKSYLGSGVSISGNYAVVGAYVYDVGSVVTEEGKAYWYERQNDGKWKEVHSVVGEKANSEFGNSVSISGNYAIVGANSYDVGTASNEGKAYWYERQNDGKWKEVHSVVGEKANSDFGYSVSISGNYAVVGADLYDVGTASNEGKAYIYQKCY